MANEAFSWLKKYTELEYLKPMLENRQLHLGKLEKWDDKNDSKLIQLYSNACGGPDILVNCLTMAQDRFHLWNIFGKREKGVCLWFDKEKLLADIHTDESLVANEVQYKLTKELRNLEPRCIPFAKRKQYQDEDEFRVLRVKSVGHPTPDKFEFSACSLRKVYLNPWLKRSEARKQKTDIRKMLVGELSHVKVFQNQSLRKQDWIDAARHVLKSDS